MLFLLVASFLLSFVCYSWGTLVLKLISKLSNEEEASEPIHVSLICLLGLSAVVVLAGVFSLFYPLGSWYMRAFFLLPAVIRSPKSIQEVRHKVLPGNLKVLVLFYFGCLVFLVLLMASWTISHPDTLAYHVPTIEWIRDYKVIPGLANVDLRLGLQGLWFPVCAVFDFIVNGKSVVNLINLSVCFWFLYFSMDKINISLKENNRQAIFWMCLVAISLWSYPQIRLTITSASPDFIVAVFILGITYLLLQPKNTRRFTIILLFSAVTLCLKLSSFTILLTALYPLFWLIKKKKWRHIFFVSMTTVLVITAFLARNAITSGYLFYPSHSPDLIDSDWKIPKKLVQQQEKYITAYARTGVADTKQSKEIVSMKLAEWVPLWCSRLSLSDKFILAFLIFTFCTSLIYAKKIFAADVKTKYLFFTLLTSILFWLFLAPDLRFASGFIISFIAVMVKILHLENKLKSRKIILPLIYLSTLLTLTYSVYRMANFFSSRQLVFPLGLEQPVTEPILCNGIKINLPIYEREQPYENSCEQFILRGNNIEDGFRSK